MSDQSRDLLQRIVLDRVTVAERAIETITHQCQSVV